MSARSEMWRAQFATAKLGPSSPESAPDTRLAAPILSARWPPWIFAAKTTASGLLALLIAFAFDLDQPKWALLTVFIVAQPQSGFVLAKSFYRLIGTFAGAAVALLLVSLFAQERVLFLGALAIWIGFCTFASKQARNFMSYGFVLSGYTVAIVGIPGALDAGNAFFVAVARVTEVSLGIMITAAISHIVFPSTLASSLRRAVAANRVQVAAYATALLGGGDTDPMRAKLLGQAIEIENLRASAVFEDPDIRERDDALRRLDVAMLGVMDVASLLSRSLAWFRRAGVALGPALDEVLKQAATASDLWRAGRLDAAGLHQRFVAASAGLPLAREFYLDPCMADEEILRRASIMGHLRQFFDALVAFAEAHEIFAVPRARAVQPSRFSVSNDRVDNVWAGVRAAMALLLVGVFWILANWPSGVTATILAAVATARLATMEQSTKAAAAGTILFALAPAPAFMFVEVLLPGIEGFTMFALVVAPVLFGCAYLMARPKTAGLGFLLGLYFASLAGFQNRMAYDPTGFINTAIATVVAVATAAVLFAIIAPDTPEAARRRFGRIARAAFDRIFRRRRPIGLAEFETSVAEALDQLRRALRPKGGEDIAAVEAGTALLGAGRELIRIRDEGRPAPTTAVAAAGDVAHGIVSGARSMFDRAARAAQDAAARCLAELRGDRLGAADARAAAREMVAFAAIRDELERGGELLLDERPKGALTHVA